jgi:protein O-GlcNAc transferase
MSLLARLRSAFTSGSNRSDALERAIALHESGRLEDAENAYNALLAGDRDNAQALHLLGVVALQRGRHRDAMERIREAIGRDPDIALFHFNLANAWLELGDSAAAMESLRRAVALDPGHAAAWFNLGEALYRAEDRPGSVEALRNAARLTPDDATTAIALARSLIAGADEHVVDSAAYGEADGMLEPLWQRSDNPLDARMMLAHALQQHGEWSRAAAHYEGVLAVSPDDERGHNNLANCCNSLGRRADAVHHYGEVLRLSPTNALAGSSILSAMNYDEDATPGQMLEAHRAWARRFADPLPRPVSYPHSRDANRPLRIGYVSPDLRQHVVSHLFAPVLERHDRQSFETFCYYSHPHADAMTGRLRGLSHQWRQVHDLNDEQVAARIREDRIDILVDLAGHTSYGRLLTFGRRPAPVQVSWLGYFYSTGLAQMDAFVSDVHSSPPGQERWFSERLERLPDTRFVFEPHPYFPEPGPLPALSRGCVTFGCLNNVGKVNDRVLALWAQVLGRVPRSRLLLQSRPFSDAPFRDAFIARCERHGIPRDRLEVRAWAPLERAAHTYHDIDIALDPFPFCGGMTSFDCLWMGVPVVTLAGALIAGRQTSSMLMNVGMPELIAPDTAAYVDLAARLAADLPAVERMRAELRGRMQASPLLDYERFTRELEKLYRRLWRRWAEAA